VCLTSYLSTLRIYVEGCGANSFAYAHEVASIGEVPKCRKGLGSFCETFISYFLAKPTEILQIKPLEYCQNLLRLLYLYCSMQE